MVRGENIGGLKKETKKAFKIVEIKGNFKNHNAVMERLLELYNLYNEEYEAQLKKQTEQ